jgi:hypothetical protein
MFFIFDKYLLSAAIQPECYDKSVVMWQQIFEFEVDMSLSFD